MNIRLHIVAPDTRPQKVFEEIQWPIFSLLENQPLHERCSFLTYEAVRDLAKAPNLAYPSDRVIEEYEESAAD